MKRILLFITTLFLLQLHAQIPMDYECIIPTPSNAITLSQINLPVTFEDTAVDYTMSDFGGNASSMITDPTDASNSVMQVVKT